MEDCSLKYKSYTFITEGKRDKKKTIATISYCLTDGRIMSDSEWKNKVHQQILTNQEQELFNNLLYIVGNYGWFKTKEEIEEYALELYTCRMFENKEWFMYQRFKERFLENNQLSLI